MSIVIDYNLLINNIMLINNGTKVFVEFSKTESKHSGGVSFDVVPLNGKI